MGTIGRFEIKTWDEEPYEKDEEAKLSRPRLTNTFEGDVVGEGSAEFPMACAAVEGSAAYTGFERMSGSFVLHHTDGGYVFNLDHGFAGRK